MAVFTTSATELKYASASSWTSGKTRQGVYDSTRYEGAINFGGLSELTFNNIDITQIQMQITFTASGGDSSKYFTMYKSAKSSISGTIASMRGDSIGAVLISGAYNATRTITFSATENSGIFNTLKTYFSAGNRILIIYVPTSRGSYGSYDYDYLTANAITLTLTYNHTRSEGTLENSSVNAGTWQKLNIQAYSSEYTHKVIWTFGDYTTTQDVAAGTTYAQYTIPLSWLNAIPNATSGQATCKLETYDTDDTLLGSATYGFTITAGTAIVPTLTSVTASPVNTNPSLMSWGIYATGKSSVSIVMTGASGIYGSTITGYSITTEPNVGSGTASTLTTPTLYRNGTITVTAAITDSRGRTASKTTTFTVYQYDAPSFTKVECYRCTSTGTRDEASGTYAYIKATFGCSALTGSNTATCSLHFYQQGGTYSTTISLTSGTAVIIGGGQLATDAVFNADFTLTDTVGTETEYSDIINSASYIIHIKKGGGAIGFGMAAGADETVSMGWPLKLTEPLEVTEGGTGSTTVAGARNALGLGNTSGALPVANGGTGATTVAAARNALGLGDTSGALPIANGGTGVTTAAAIRNALGLGNTTDALPVANGGTGVTTIDDLKTALGFPLSAGDLSDFSGSSTCLKLGGVIIAAGGLSAASMTKVATKTISLSDFGFTSRPIIIANAYCKIGRAHV